MGYENSWIHLSLLLKIGTAERNGTGNGNVMYGLNKAAHQHKSSLQQLQIGPDSKAKAEPQVLPS